MGDRDHDFAAAGIGAREGGIGALHFQLLLPADEMQGRIADKRTGQEAGFGENLETVAHAQHIAAARGMGLQLRNDR